MGFLFWGVEFGITLGFGGFGEFVLVRSTLFLKHLTYRGVGDILMNRGRIHPYYTPQILN